MQPVRGCSDENEAVIKYKFSMDLKTIQFNSPGRGRVTNCIVNYKYKPFTNTEVSTRPSFAIEAYDDSLKEIRRGMHYRFALTRLQKEVISRSLVTVFSKGSAAFVRPF